MLTKQYEPISGELFHVHTYRCGHAGEETDEEYVKKAVELGASRIVFTDHAPFPGDKFLWRMSMAQLEDYVESIHALKHQYSDKIEILCGLEAEFLPSYVDYYRDLRASGNFDLLLLGQHMFEYDVTHYSYTDADHSEEYIGLCNAIATGIDTGLFEVVAHPDRSFRDRSFFEEAERIAAQKVIDHAVQNGVFLERNYSSTLEDNQYWPQFWELVPDHALVLKGLDAHSVERLEQGWHKFL